MSFPAAVARPKSSPTGSGRLMKVHRPIRVGADELLHQRVLAAAQFIGCALGHDTAIGNHGHLVGYAEGFVQVMGNDHAGQAQGVIQITDQPGGHAQRDRVQAREGFVVKHQIRVQRDRPRQGHAPRHAARHLGRHQVARATQAHGIELHQDQITDHRLRQPGVLAQGEGHVFENRQIGEQGAELEQHAHAAAHGVELIKIKPRQILAIEQDLACYRTNLPAEQAQHRGLAAARGTDEGQYLAARDAQVHLFQNHALAIAAADLAQFD